MRNLHPPHNQARRKSAGRLMAAAGAVAVALSFIGTAASSAASPPSVSHPTTSHHRRATTVTLPSDPERAFARATRSILPHKPPTTAARLAGVVSVAPSAGIPADWVHWASQATTHKCSTLSPLVLLAIGKNESRWDESTLPGVHSGSNSEGAEGPMQFMPQTFAYFAGPRANPYDSKTALFVAASYLCYLGGGSDWQNAVWVYCGGRASPTAATECDGYVELVAGEIESFKR